ncbi:MAG: NAD-dependent epimerase/dehydratase family protein [Ilumatobacteraceae bacterium]
MTSAPVESEPAVIPGGPGIIDHRTTVLVTGTESGLGVRVVTLLGNRPEFDIVPAAVAMATSDEVASPLDAGRIDIAVHLAAGDHDTRARRRESVTKGAASLLEAARARDVRHIVLLSSAMVYGAWANNPVPLTEDAALRPDLDFVFARQLASVEQMVDDWRTSAPGRTATVLRPVISMAADGTSSLARALAAGLGQRSGEDDPGAQFVHLDDLAAAVLIATERRLDGVFNVAPDGWVASDRVRALAGSAPKVKLPARVAEVVTRIRWQFQRGPIPPGLRSYTHSPWLVANDRLKQQGWRPLVTNEQAYVEGTEAKWWTMITPKRKQELALGGMIATAAGLVALVVSLVRRSRRRRHA